jgi:hypothetical protein
MSNELDLSKISFNVLLHTTILFIVLVLLFMLVIRHVASTAITNEVVHLVNDEIKKNIIEIKTMKTNAMKQIGEYTKKLEALNEKYNITNNNVDKNIIKNNINNIGNLINNYRKDNISYDYYISLFSKPDETYYNVNKQIVFYIKFVCVLLIFILVLFGSYLYIENKLTSTELGIIGLENLITFILVGIFEYMFFTNVAIKFIPAPPSLLFKSMFESLKKNF